MKVDLGAPVILRIDQPDLWHMPAATMRTLTHVEISIDDALERLAATWPTLCDEGCGEVFVYGGFVRQRRLCRGCAFVNEQAPHLLPAGEFDAIAAYDARRALEPELDQEAA